MLILENDDFQQKSAEFLIWLSQLQGVTLSPKIQIADLRSRRAGRGIVAVDDIEVNEDLFSISCFDLLTVQNSNLPKRIPDEFEELDPWMSLVLVMIYEVGQGEDSKWGPYLQILPSEFDTLMYWSAAELAELQGSLVVKKIGKDDANRSFIECLLPIVKGHSSLFGKFASVFGGLGAEEALLEMAHRMATLVMAYAFDIAKYDESDGGYEDDCSTLVDIPKAMVPLADIFNADGEMMNAHLLQQEDSMTMITSKAVKKGQEILNDYGERPRSDLLRRYGYIPDSAKKWDLVELNRETMLQIASDHHKLGDSERNERLQLFDNWNGFGEVDELRRQPRGKEFEFDAALLGLVHIFTMERDSFKIAQMSGKAPDEPPLNLQVFLVLKKVIIERINTYDTSVAEDIVLLQDLTLQARVRMAIEVRLGEKEILVAALDSVEKRIEALSQTVCPCPQSQELPQQGSTKKKRRL